MPSFPPRVSTFLCGLTELQTGCVGVGLASIVWALYSIVTHPTPAVILTSLAEIAFSSALVYGVKKEQPRLLVAWLASQVVWLVLSLLLLAGLICYLAADPGSDLEAAGEFAARAFIYDLDELHLGIMATVFAVSIFVTIVIYCYFWIVVYSYYRILLLERFSPTAFADVVGMEVGEGEAKVELG